MEALFARLAGLALSPALPVFWPNLSFTPPADKKFLRAQFIPNQTERQQIPSDGAHRYIGLFQVSVFWPIGQGESGPRQVAGVVAAHFACDQRLTRGDVSVRITKRPHVADVIAENDRIMIPVMIDWECFY